MADTDPLIGGTLGHYRVLERLGAGGMGVVYRAEDVRLQRFVALKVLPQDDASDPVAVERLYREACAASALSHPNICVVYDLGTDQGRTFIVMELLEGQTLKDAIAARALATDAALDLALQIGDALDSAHAHNLIHRDIKPGNIFVTHRGQAKVLDFGLAKRTTGADDDRLVTQAKADLTRSGTALGTTAYMSPEQLRGDDLDRRTDIFSFGLVLYEMLTGRQAFTAATTIMVADAILHHDPPPPSSANPLVPRGLDEAMARALAKDRERRYQTIAAMVADITTLRAGRHAVTGPIAAAPASPPPAAARARPARKSDSSKARTIGSLAVLPFINVAPDAGTEADYLSDGITENIINKLSQLAGLRVVPRTTVFRYKGTAIDPVAAAGELKARAVVVGRVLQRDRRLIVNVELVDVKKQAQLWGEQYNRPLADVFEVQEAIAAEISRSLQLKLSGDDQKKLAKRDTYDAAAYQAYLKGRFYWNRRSLDGLLQATEHFQHAIEIDPQYAPAHTGLSDTFNLLGYYNNRRPLEVYPRAQAAASRALEVDNSSAEAHASLGYTRLFFDRDWPGAEREFLDAIRLKPDYASAHQWYAWLLMATGRHDEMVAAMRRAQALDPLSLIVNAHLGYSLTIVGHLDEARQQLQATLDLDPNFALTYQKLGGLYLQQGSNDRAIEAFDSAVRLSSGRVALGFLGHAAGVAGRTDRAREALTTLEGFARERFVSPLEFALVHAGLGEADAAFAALGRAVDERISDLIRVRLLPWPDAVRRDSRFAALVARLGFPDAQGESTAIGVTR